MARKILAIIVTIVTIIVVFIAVASLLKLFTSYPSREGQPSSRTYDSRSAQSRGGATTWRFDGTAWQGPPDAPPCIDPLTLQSPVDVNLATSILYPGQLRSGAFNPHGGFRFDGLVNDDITVRIPADGVLVRGSRYLAFGEVQYMFDIITPCGIMHRLDHLAILTPPFADLAEQLPTPIANDSTTTDFTPPIPVTAGSVIATSVGFKKTSNTFFDWGVYDMRTVNAASQDPSFRPQYNPEQASYGICWLDLLSPTDSTIVKNLPPGDPQSGRQSDYCK